METTLNIHSDILEKINRAADKSGIARSEMILFLIKKAMDDIVNPENIGKMVKYQKRSKPVEWHTFHLQVRWDDYEYLLDLRKLLKMSVSLILAYVVSKYLCAEKKVCITDNYRYKNYIIAKEVIDDIICWKFIWGYPHRLDKFIRF